MQVQKKRASIILLIVFILLAILFFIRLFNTRDLDDVTPGIPCSYDLLARVDTLYVIPLYNNRSIADDKEWCSFILSLNKTIGLHGVYHTYKEFGYSRDKIYLDIGAIEFEKCFGFKPTLFKAPQLSLSRENKRWIEKDYLVETWFDRVFHKTYHCSNDGYFPNWVDDLL